MLNQWAQFSAREQVLISIAGALLVILILTFVVFRPMYSFNVSAKADYSRAVQTSQLVHRVVGNRGASQNASGAAPEALRKIILETSAAQKLSIARLDSRENGTVLQVSVRDTDSKALLAWLAALEQSQNIYVTRATVRKSNNAGLVTADLDFSRMN